MAHNKTLTELKWFKWALWGPIGAAAVISTLIGVADFTNENLRVCFTSTCVNEAISRLKFPLAIASLAFPLVALVASHHRSVQTAAQIARTDRQIEATEAKNSFENTLKHRELFDKKLIDIERQFDMVFQDKATLYDRIFCKNKGLGFSFYCDEMSFNPKDFGAGIEYNEGLNNYMDYIDSGILDINNNIEKKIANEKKDFSRIVSGYLVFFLSKYFLVRSISGTSHITFLSNSNTCLYSGLNQNETLEKLITDINFLVEMLRRFCLSPDAYGDRYFDSNNQKREDVSFARNKVVSYLSRLPKK